MILELAKQVQDGEVNPLSAYIQLKKMEAEMKTAMSTIQPLAIDEADKWKEKTFKMEGALVEKRSSPCTWDYSEVAAYNQAKERLKYIEKVAQIGGGVDPQTGEEINKAFKIEGKSIIAVKLIA